MKGCLVGARMVPHMAACSVQGVVALWVFLLGQRWSEQPSSPYLPGAAFGLPIQFSGIAKWAAWENTKTKSAQ